MRTLYTREGGGHYHIDRNCKMLQGGDFERLGYSLINERNISRKHLRPCPFCAQQQRTRKDG